MSSNTCSDVYDGESAADQIETQNTMKYWDGLDAELSICLHSYSQLVLWPFGYASNVYPPNRAEVQKLAEDAAAAIESVHGTYYDPINSAGLCKINQISAKKPVRLLYTIFYCSVSDPAAGASDDYYQSNSRFAFTYELRDTGFWGFQLPKEQIIPTSEEAWAGIQVMLQKVIDGKK